MPTYASAADPSLDSDPEPPFSNDRVFQATFPRTNSVTERVPPVDIVISSVSIYFRHIHPWLPFLDAQHVLTDLANMREPSLLHHAIFGASLPFLYDSRLDQPSSDAFWKYTKRRIFTESAEEPSFASLEASTILTLDLSGMTNGPQVWGRLAVIAKLASQLRTDSGLVLRPNVQADAQSAYTRRPCTGQHARLFWAIYALDSFVSITTNQPPCLSDHDLRFFLPTREAAWRSEHDDVEQQTHPVWRNSSPSPSVYFLRQLELLDIARQAHKVYLEYFLLEEEDNMANRDTNWFEMLTGCSNALDAWLEGLPSSVKIGPSSLPGRDRPSDISSPITVTLNAYGHALVVYLNGLIRINSRALPQDRIPELQHSSHDKCMRSVDAIVEIAAECTDATSDQLGWPFAWTLWTAARYLLVVATQNLAMPPQPQFQILTSSLHKMGKFWQISKKYWWLLRRAMDALHAQRCSAEQHDPSPIVASMSDLRVPTSHLEDQFRVDPVLSRRDETRNGSTTGGSTQSSSSAFPGPGPAEIGEMISPQLPYEATLYGSIGNMSGVWFTTPLFASSAYQQFADYSNAENSIWDDASWMPQS